MSTATDSVTSRKVVCPHCHSVNRTSLARSALEASCGKCKGRLFTGEPVELNRENFHSHVERNEIPIIVDLWAPWCAPCRMMAPIVERAAAALEPGVRVAKLNTEAEPELAARFRIRGIPTLIAFKAGVEVARNVGAMDYAGLIRWAQTVADKASP
jgi:thioredoxin 2